VPTLVVELNDAGVLARRDPDPAGAEPAPSPGYALIDEDRLLTGGEAAARARLKPRHVNNRFWSELDTTPLSRPFPDHLTHADLAHAHLAALWGEVGSGVDCVLLAVPGTQSSHQLGLTLGIARECGMPVAGMVDAAVAAASGGYPEARLLHLDLQLHRTVLTELSQGAEIERRRVELSRHAGIAALHDLWAKRVAELFVRGTRFDPLHVAATEQALYDRLPDLLELLCREESVLFEMEAGGGMHSVRLTRSQLAAATDAAYEGIVQLVRLRKPARERATLLLSHRAAGLPGLRERLDAIADTGIVSLPQGAAAGGALEGRDRIRSPDEALPFVTRLPASGTVPPPREEGAAKSTVRPDQRPTHLLHLGRAYPITERPFVLGVAIPAGSRGLNLTGATAGVSRNHCSVYRGGDRVLVDDHSTHGSFLNDQRIDGVAELAAGDRLRVGSPGIELQLIGTADDDGAPPD